MSGDRTRILGMLADGKITAAEAETLLDAPGGHMGILGGSRAPQTIWKPVADWLAAR